MEIFLNGLEQQLNSPACGGRIQFAVAVAGDVHKHIAHERCKLKGAVALVDGGNHHRVGVIAPLFGTAIRADEEHVDELIARVVFGHLCKLRIGEIGLFVIFRNG